MAIFCGRNTLILQRLTFCWDYQFLDIQIYLGLLLGHSSRKLRKQSASLPEYCARSRFQYCRQTFYLNFLDGSCCHVVSTFVRMAAHTTPLGPLMRTPLHHWRHLRSLWYHMMLALLPLCQHWFHLRNHFSAAKRLD